MRKRSLLDRLFGGDADQATDESRPGDALFYVPQIRRLEDRRVLAAGAIAVDAGVDLSGVAEGTSAALSGATFTDPDGNQPHAAEIDWGDGSPIEPATIDETDGSINGSHTYADDGSYTVKVTVVGSVAGSIGEDTTLVQVVNQAPTNVAMLISVPPVQENDTVVLDGVFEDAGVLDTHTVTIDWGDGSPVEMATVVEPTSSEPGKFSSTHTYLNDGDYSISVAVNDGIDTTLAGTSLTVENVAPSNLAISIDSNTIDESSSVTLTGSFLDPGSLDEHLVSVDWGDGESTSVTLTAGVTSFVLTHSYDDDPPVGNLTDIYTVSVTVADDGPLTAAATAEVQVNNVAPSNLALSVSPLSIAENGEVTLTGTFIEVDSADSYSVEINWGDGSANTLFTLAPGSTGFSKSHIYLDDPPPSALSDHFTISVTVTDNDAGVATATTNVEVINVDPELITLTLDNAVIDEDGTIHLQGLLEDLGSLDGHEIEIDWGDGNVETISLTPLESTFNLSHKYLDDGLTSAMVDNYTINGLLSDDDGGTAAVTQSVSVTNVAPQLTSLTIQPVFEGQTATLMGTYSDQGTLDTHKVDIDWNGDGTFDQLGLAVTGGSFSFTHVYADDDPTGTSSDTFNVNVRLHDDDGGVANGSVSQSVTNVAPVTSALNATAILENGTTTLTGKIVDPGMPDSFTLVVNWGDPSSPNNLQTFNFAAGTKTFSLTHKYLDDNPSGTASDTYTIQLSLTDDDSGSTNSSTQVSVTNVAPQLTSLTIQPVFEGQTATLMGTYSDQGTLDTHKVDIDWNGDGTFDQLGLAVTGGSFSFKHVYADDDPTGTSSDTFNVNVRLHDDDGGVANGSVSQTVTNVAPVTSALNATAILENGTTTLTGKIVDPGTLDSFSLVVNWGDALSPNNLETYTFAAGTTNFSLTHQYLDDNPSGTSSDNYTIQLSLTDDDTGVGTSSAQVTVNNVAPVLDSVSATTISENGTTTLAGNIIDPGTLDSFTLVVNWGDSLSPNNMETYTFAAGTTNFSLTHQYLDDNPSGTSSDNYTIQLSLTDDDTGVGTSTAQVTVNNVTPVLDSVSATTINENGSTTLTGDIIDPGTLDSFTLVVNWGDASSPNNVQTFNFAAGTTSFSLTHQYLDDNPSGTSSDNYTIQLSLTDDDTGVGTSSAQVTVNNVAPVLDSVSATTINENGTTTLTGDIIDPGTLDSFTLVVNWGDTLSPNNLQTYTFAAGTTNFSLTHQYLDDNPTGTSSDNYTIQLSLTDDDTGNATTNTQVTVNNVAPVLDSVSATTISENGTTTLAGNIIDPGTLDSFTLVVNWGDASSPNNVQTFNFAAGTTSFSLTHQYLDDNPSGTSSDNYTIQLSLTDDDTGVGTSSAQVTVNNVAPVLDSVSATTINENGTTTLTGDIIDPGTLDSFSLVVNWGDASSPNNVQTFNFAAGTTSFSLTHQYLDDNPSGTSSDNYTIQLSLTDDDTGVGTSTAQVTVNNVAPVLDSVSATTNNENGTTTLTGEIIDPGTLDSFTLVVNWGDTLSPNNLETYTFAAGTTNFSLTHQYLDDNPSGTSSDNYTIQLSLTDDDTGVGTSSAQVTVNNVTPVLDSVSATTINENGSTTLTGDIIDPGTLDSFTLVVNWGDSLSPNNMETYTFAAGTTNFSLTHQYLDDNPSGTSSDNYTIQLSLTDDDTGVGTSTAQVTVNNVTPVLDSVSATTINENGSTTLTGDIIDPGTLDSFTLVVNWGDASSPNNVQTFNFAAGTTSFSLTHQYLDDNPSGTSSDNYTIQLSLTDDDTGVGTSSAQVTVNNVAPVLDSVSATTINENGTTTLTGDIIDAGTLDSFTLVVNWGDTLSPNNLETYTFAAGTTTFSLTHKYLDDNPSGTSSDNYTIQLSLTDDDTGVGTANTQVTVNNVAPVLDSVSATTINENGTTTLTGDIIDPGTLDSFTLVVNWGDTLSPNNLQTYTFAAGTTNFSLTHQYLDDNPTGTSSDTYTIQLSLTDDDTGVATTTTPVVVTNVAPLLINVSGSTILENGIATVSATIADPGTLDVFSVTVNWQDGTPPDMISGLGTTDSTGVVGGTSYTWNAADRLLVLNHQFLDDGTFPGNGTASDTYIVTLNINDDDLGVGSATATVVVNNVAPQFINVVGSTINEDAVATVTATVNDPGTRDTFVVSVDWKDGSSVDTLPLLGLTDSAGIVGGTEYQWLASTRSLTLRHQYLDDGPFPGNGTPSDTYAVALTISDDDLGLGSTTTNVIINNVIPSQIVFTATPNVINENNSVSISGTFVDTGRQDQHTLMVNWGDGTPVEAITTFTSSNGQGTFSATHFYFDDNDTGTPSDINVIRVFVTDDDQGTGVGEYNITVNDIAPVIGSVSATQLDNTGSTTLTGTFSDVGTQDTFSVRIDWGDGTSETLFFPVGATAFSVSHGYSAPPDPDNPANDIPVTITVADDDTLNAMAIALVDVPGKNVFGSFIDLAPAAEPLEFPVTANIVGTPSQSPPPLGSSRNVIVQQGGFDVAVGADRQVILRTVSIRGDEGNELTLPEDQLDDMASLFRRLPDGRYRLYLRQGKIERLILDVYIRQGKPIDPGDEHDGTRDRPPTSQAEPKNTAEGVVQLKAEKARPHMNDNSAETSADQNEIDWSKSARLFREIRRRSASC